MNPHPHACHAQDKACALAQRIHYRMCEYAMPIVTSCISKSPPHVQDRRTMHILLPTRELIMPSTA